MRIAQIHNKYKDLGGEDVVVERERLMLDNAGHEVVQFFVSNDDLNSTFDKLKVAFNMTHNTRSKKAVIDFLKLHKPDIAHVHNFLPILSPSVFEACKTLNIPVVLTLHNFRLLCINGLLYRNHKVCEKCISKPFASPGIQHGCYQDSSFISVFPALSNAINTKRNTWQDQIDKVIFLSEFSKNVFDRSHLQFTPEQTVIKSHFVEDRGYTYDKGDYFLFVGRLSEEKGIDIIIEAFRKVDYKLIVAGDGPLKEELIHSNKDRDNIKFLGFQDQEELRELYLNAKALITASKMYESFGLVIIEAFSYGTPVIAPDFGNAGELITHNDNGLKYTKDSVEALAKTVQMFENCDIKNLTRNARDTFTSTYTATRNLAYIEAIYDSALQL